MDNKLYRIEVVAWDNLPDINTTGMLYTDKGVAFVKLHPIKIKAQPKCEVVHSSWILNDDGSGTCRNCHRTTLYVWDMDNWLNYCPNCGADMRGV